MKIKRVHSIVRTAVVMLAGPEQAGIVSRQVDCSQGGSTLDT
jgi:hypothetical protein